MGHCMMFSLWCESLFTNTRFRVFFVVVVVFVLFCFVLNFRME